MFRALGGNVQHIGEESGRANALDSALLALMWGALFGTLHAIAVCQAEEIGLGELAQQWTATAPVVEGLVADLIRRANAGRFASDDETLSSISAHYGSFQHLLELMEAREIDAPWSSVTTRSSNGRLQLASYMKILRRYHNFSESPHKSCGKQRRT